MNYKVHLIVGASGSGKSTLGKQLEDAGMEQLISITTREIREGETDGVDYHFVTEEEIRSLDLVEQTTYSGNTYGLSKSEVFEKTKYTDTYFITDKNGAKQIMEMLPDDCVYFWLDISPEVMLERMLQRGDSAEEAIQRYEYALKTGEFNEPDIKHYKISGESHPKMNAFFILSV